MCLRNLFACTWLVFILSLDMFQAYTYKLMFVRNSNKSKITRNCASTPSSNKDFLSSYQGFSSYQEARGLWVIVMSLVHYRKIRKIQISTKKVKRTPHSKLITTTVCSSKFKKLNFIVWTESFNLCFWLSLTKVISLSINIFLYHYYL